jgi:hypothetical protein
VVVYLPRERSRLRDVAAGKPRHPQVIRPWKIQYYQANEIQRPAGWHAPDWNASEKNTKLPVSCLDAAKQKRAGCEPPRDFLKSAFD